MLRCTLMCLVVVTRSKVLREDDLSMARLRSGVVGFNRSLGRVVEINELLYYDATNYPRILLYFIHFYS